MVISSIAIEKRSTDIVFPKLEVDGAKKPDQPPKKAPQAEPK